MRQNLVRAVGNWLIVILYFIGGEAVAETGIRVGGGIQSGTQVSDDFEGGGFSQEKSDKVYAISLVGYKSGAPGKVILTGYFSEYLTSSGFRVSDESVFVGLVQNVVTTELYDLELGGGAMWGSVSQLPAGGGNPYLPRYTLAFRAGAGVRITEKVSLYAHYLFATDFGDYETNISIAELQIMF